MNGQKYHLCSKKVAKPCIYVNIEEGNPTFLTSRLYYKATVSRQYITGTKTETPMEQVRKPWQIHVLHGHLILDNFCY